jgi:hypothetical protein
MKLLPPTLCAQTFFYNGYQQNQIVNLKTLPTTNSFFNSKGRLRYLDPIFIPILLNLREIEVEVDLRESLVIEELTEKINFEEIKVFPNIQDGQRSSIEASTTQE